MLISRSGLPFAIDPYLLNCSVPYCQLLASYATELKVGVDNGSGVLSFAFTCIQRTPRPLNRLHESRPSLSFHLGPRSNPEYNVKADKSECLSGLDGVLVLCREIHEVFNLRQSICFKALHQFYLLFLAETSLPHRNIVIWVCV